MRSSTDQRHAAFDPFGEPMTVARADLPSVCADPKGYAETRRAVFVFWALALLFVGSRIYLADLPAEHAAVTSAAPVSAQFAANR